VRYFQKVVVNGSCLLSVGTTVKTMADRHDDPLVSQLVQPPFAQAGVKGLAIRESAG
jgi:hypothetical protein